MTNGRGKVSARENRAKRREVLMREGNPLRASDFPETLMNAPLTSQRFT
jgi:hypothetical protein